MKAKYLILKSILTTTLFILAVFFEDASQERLTLLILFFSLFLAWGYIRPYLGSLFWLFIIDAVILFFLEYQSKYLINYFLHSLYILIILEAGINLSRKKVNYAIIPIALISLYKFFMLLIFQFNARSISELMFNLFALLFIITMVNYTLLQREEKQRNQLLYQELLETHHKLKKYIKQSEQSAILEERHRIARDIHDTVGHQLTSLIMQLEMINLHLKNDDNKEIIIEMLNKTKGSARNSLAETRKAVNALQGEETLGIEAIENLLDKIKNENRIDIEYTYKNDLNKLNLMPEESYVLYRIIQESITNAIRHGRSNKIKVSIGVNYEARLFFSIINPLEEQNNFVEGFGMKNMRIRVEKLLGSIHFVATEEEFKVIGDFPLKGIQGSLKNQEAMGR